MIPHHSTLCQLYSSCRNLITHPLNWISTQPTEQGWVLDEKHQTQIEIGPWKKHIYIRTRILWVLVAEYPLKLYGFHEFGWTKVGQFAVRTIFCGVAPCTSLSFIHWIYSDASWSLFFFKKKKHARKKHKIHYRLVVSKFQQFPQIKHRNGLTVHLKIDDPAVFSGAEASLEMVAGRAAIQANCNVHTYSINKEPAPDTGEKWMEGMDDMAIAEYPRPSPERWRGGSARRAPPPPQPALRRTWLPRRGARRTMAPPPRRRSVVGRSPWPSSCGLGRCSILV